MDSIEVAVDKLIDMFDKLQGLKSIKDSAGLQRSTKGAGVADFLHTLVQHAIEGTDYMVVTQYPLYTKSGTKIIIDIGILDKDGNPLWDIESKDYIDSKMYSSFTAESIKLRVAYPNIQFMGLGMQRAMSDRIQCNALIDLGIVNIHHLYTLLPTRRDGRDSLYLLKYNRADILEQAYMLLVEIVNTIRKDNA